MAFKVFEKGSAPASTVPTVTIQKRGLFSLNQAAYNLLGEPEAVLFLWDADDRLIALQASSSGELNAYPARRQGTRPNTGPVLVAGTMFTRYIDLDTTQARRWVPSVHDGRLIVDLKEPGASVVSNRERARRITAEGTALKAREEGNTD